MKVTLLRKETLKDFFKIWGEFSCTCYDTDKKYAEKVGRSCLERNHFSGSRAFSFIFEIDGVSRACTHQLVRHSVGVTINQKSQRYCNHNNFSYVTPRNIRENEKANAIYENIMTEISNKYKELEDVMGDKKQEDIRYILPNACTTSLTIGFTLEALIHFCNERLCTSSQEEIRELAKRMRDLVVKEIPELDKYLQPKCNTGICKEKNSCNLYKKFI